MPPQSGYVSNFRSPNSAVIEPWTRIVFKMIGGDWTCLELAKGP